MLDTTTEGPSKKKRGSKKEAEPSPSKVFSMDKEATSSKKVTVKVKASKKI